MININTLGLIFSIVTSVLFWGTALMVVVRIISKAFGFKEAHLIKAFSNKRAAPSDYIWNFLAETKGINIHIKIIIFGVGIRLAMLVLGYLFMHMADMHMSIANLFHNFNRWDAPHYLRLAQYGYAHPYHDGRFIFIVFFPLYPYMIRLVNVFVGSYLAAAYVVSFATYLAALCYIYKLVRLDFSESTAWWAVVLISIFPHSFFFGAPHTESLFILTTTMTLYYIRTHKWLFAGIAGAFAAATRLVGVMLIVAAAVEFIMTYELLGKMRKGKWREFFDLVIKKGLFILLMLIGLIIYLAMNWHVTGDPFRFMHYQSTHWFNEFQYFGITMRDQFHRILPFMDDIWGPTMLYVALPNILAFAFTVWMLVYGALKRHNACYIVYALGYAFISFSPTWLLSGGRYAAALVPCFIFIADYVNRKMHRRIIVPIIFILLLLPILRMYMIGGPVM